MVPFLPAVLTKAAIGKGLGWLGQGVLAAGGAMLQNQGARRLAERQMSFQERMASTQAQRSRADFEAAGLNPALAYGVQAAAPGGASAPVSDAVGAGVSSAMAAKANKAQVDLLRTQIATEAARAGVAAAEAKEAAGRAAVWDNPAFGEIYQKAAFAGQAEQLRSALFQAAVEPHTKRMRELEAAIMGQQLPKAKAEAQFYEMFGAIPQGAGLGAQLTQSAKNLLPILRMIFNK